MDYNSPSFKCALQIVTSSKEHSVGRGNKRNFLVEKPENSTLARWSRSTSAEISHTDTVYPSSDGMSMAFYLWGLPLKKHKTPV